MDSSIPTGTPTVGVDDALLIGAEAISNALYGSAEQRRSIYRLVETTSVPIFRLGGRLCVRRSKLKEYIEALEARAAERETAS